MDSGIIIAMIGFGGVCVSTVGGMWFQHILNKKKDKEKNAFRDIIPIMHKIYGCLNSIVNHCDAIRASVFYTENGGGIPMAHSDLFCTMSHEVCNGTKSLREFYQRRPVDQNYLYMLQELLSSKTGCIRLQTKNLAPGELKSIYEEAGTQQALVFVLLRTKEKFHYCSFNFPYDGDIPASS